MEEKLGAFATCLSCMDGRVTLPVIKFIREKHGVDFVDMITEAGMDGFLARSGPLDGLLSKVDISFEKHQSTIAYIVGHSLCSGNSVEDDQHIQDVRAAIDRLRIFRDLPSLGGLFVSKDWKVSVVVPIENIPVAVPVSSSITFLSASQMVPSTIATPPTSVILPTPAAAPPRIVSKIAVIPAIPKPAAPTEKVNRRYTVVLCKSCGALNDPDSNFCDQCAKPLK
jgi:hypothetical protein